mmetsp:Transcript_4920/g.7916  ORF Transcript_4920/g.7916 Transcript_4920/m.7916 type:complete len:249 (-) Transcript_4920:1393-2139(-)
MQLTPQHQKISKDTPVKRLWVAQFVILPQFRGRGHGKKLLQTIYKLARGDPQVLDVEVESATPEFRGMRKSVELAILRDASMARVLRGTEVPWGDLQARFKFSMSQLFLLADALGSSVKGRGVKRTNNQTYPAVAGIPVDMDSLYTRAQALGFTKPELDDLLHAIGPEDLEGVQGPEEAADRLLEGVYLAVVSDLASAEGLSDMEIDMALGKVKASELVECQSVRALAAVVLPVLKQVKTSRKGTWST